MKVSAKIYSSQNPKKESIETVAKAGVERGKTIRKNIVK